MKLVIDISDETYKEIIDDAEHSPRNLSHYEWVIARGTPLPKGHGRLIDADALWKKWVFDAIGKQEIDDAPTIIEADTESEDAE